MKRKHVWKGVEWVPMEKTYSVKITVIVETNGLARESVNAIASEMSAKAYVELRRIFTTNQIDYKP